MTAGPESWYRSQRKTIPERVKPLLRARLEKHVRDHWHEQCRELKIRFRGAFAYVDAFPRGQMPPTPWLTAEQRAEAEATPTQLCRLGYLGDDQLWEFGFYKYSDSKYELSFLPTGSFEGTPEDIFDCAAGVYLMD